MSADHLVEWSKGVASASQITQTRVPVFAFEGIGGSGKSHVSELVKIELAYEGLNVYEGTVAGLGDSPVARKLKEIKAYRHALVDDKSVTPKQEEDQRRDRIFRLAARYQTRVLERDLLSREYDCALVNRTPLMCWVFAKANDLRNPYLDEMLEEGLALASGIGLRKVFLFDLPVTTAYSRIATRYSLNDPYWASRLFDACRGIATPEQVAEIYQKAVRQRELAGSLRSKDLEGWDFIPIDHAERERKIHVQALEALRARAGVDFEMVDAEKPITQLVSELTQSILKNYGRSSR